MSKTTKHTVKEAIKDGLVDGTQEFFRPIRILFSLFGMLFKG